MRNSELKNALVDLLETKLERFKRFPQEFTPKELAAELGAVATSVGHVANDAVSELRDRGWKVRYERSKRPRKLILMGRR